jgi:hypothetical protein
MYPINAFANVYRINVMEEREGQSEGERAVGTTTGTRLLPTLRRGRG